MFFSDNDGEIEYVVDVFNKADSAKAAEASGNWGCG